MRLLRLYLVSLSDLGEISVEIFSDLNLFLPRFELLKNVSNPKLFIHVGFSRPSDSSLLKLFGDKKRAIFFTNSAKFILDKFIQHFGTIVDSIDNESVFDSLSISAQEKNEENSSNSILSELKTSADVEKKTNGEDLLIIPNWAVRGNSFVWFKDFAIKFPDMAKVVIDFGITNDLTYQINEEKLDMDLRLALAKHRGSFLLPLLKFNELQDFCRVIPPWGLKISTTELNFSIRTANRLALLGIKTLGDFSKFTNQALMKAPGFGMKSLTEVRSELDKQIRSFIDPNFSNDQSVKTNSDDRARNYSENRPQNSQRTSSGNDLNFDTEFSLSNDYNSATLLELLEGALAKVKADHAEVFRLRIGLNSQDHTLQEVGNILGVTRSRIGQMSYAAKNHLLKIIRLDDILQKKLDAIRKDLVIPLQVESLSNYDSWFLGVENRPWLIKALFNEFEIGYKVHEYEGLNIITVGEYRFIDEIVRSTKALVKASVDEQITKNNIRTHISNQIAATSPELIEFILGESTKFARFIPYGNEEKLVAFGFGADSLVTGVLEKSEVPLRAEEILRRIQEDFDQSPDIRRVRNACADLSFLFAPSTFGLRKHLMLTDDQVKDISELVLQLMLSESKSRQWHTQEILQNLSELTIDYDPPINQYTLGICMDLSGKFVSLGRMVYTLNTDSSGNAPKRIEFSQFIEAVLERSPTPLHKDVIIKQVTSERGLSQFRQIFQFGRLVKVATNVWALMDKHLNLSETDFEKIVLEISNAISSIGHGLTQQELVQALGSNSVSSRFFDNPFVLESLALKAKKCKKIDSFLYLSEWGDCQRTTFQSAMTKIVKEMPEDGLSIRDVMDKLNVLYDQPYKREAVNPVLRDCGASYDENSGKWRVVEETQE